MVTAGRLLISGFAASGPIRWAARGIAAALAGLAVVIPAGGWIGSRARVRRRPATVREPARIVREPESAWWDGDLGPNQAAVTVAIVGEPELRWGADAMLACLADLAVTDELVVVWAAEQRPGHHAVVAGLRHRLPRHRVVALHVASHGVAFLVAQHGGGLGREDAALLNQLLEYGSLPVVVTPAAALHEVAAQLSSHLRADRVLRAHRTAGGVDLHQVWSRQVAANVG